MKRLLYLLAAVLIVQLCIQHIVTSNVISSKNDQNKLINIAKESKRRTIQQEHYGIKSPHNDRENLKVMLYVTTHMSPQHIWYLKSCWYPALQNSLLLRSSDVVVYLNPPENELQEAKKILQDTFEHQKLTILTHYTHIH